jgi:hypothetical protein
MNNPDRNSNKVRFDGGADRELAMWAGRLRAETRGKGLSLGDRYCLARTASRNAVAVTADRASADLDISLSIELVRQAAWQNVSFSSLSAKTCPSAIDPKSDAASAG